MLRRFRIPIAALLILGLSTVGALAGKPVSMKLTVSVSPSKIIEGSTATATVTRSSSTGETTTNTTAFRHDGTFQPIAGSRSVAFAMCLNDAADAAYFDSAYNSMLLHTGFAPDYAEQHISLSNAIAADDPLKSEFVNSEPGVYAINDRDDVTGYPQLVLYNGRFGRQWWENQSGRHPDAVPGSVTLRTSYANWYRLAVCSFLERACSA